MWRCYVENLAVDISSVEAVPVLLVLCFATGACRNGYDFYC
ncbi:MULTISPECIES: hypothetical protein [Clostridium]|nr:MULTISPECIES: hypothetical protein [Clostridium]